MTTSKTAKKLHQTQYPEITEILDLWVLKAMGNGILLTGDTLCEKWTQFVDLAEVPKDDHLDLSQGLLEKYKKRNGLKVFK